MNPRSNMNSQKFVLESFIDFLQYEFEVINEKRDSGDPLDVGGSKDLINLIMDYNTKLANDLFEKSEGLKGKYLQAAVSSLQDKEYAKAGLYSMVSRIIGYQIDDTRFNILSKIMPKLKKEDFDIKKSRNIISKEIFNGISQTTEQEAKERLEDVIKIVDRDNIVPSIFTCVIWGTLLSEQEKETVSENFFIEAKKKGYDTKDGLKTVIEKEYKKLSKEGNKAIMYNPGISAYPNKTEAEKTIEGEPVITTTQVKRSMIEQDKELFKPNATGKNGGEDYIDGSLEELANNLGSVFQRLITGEVTSIKSIKILTSADRYRNTKDASQLTWGQLSYMRSLSMATLVQDIAEKSGISPEILEKIKNLTILDFFGTNGDGTSGPNPPDGRFGYYNEDKKWVDGKDREIVSIIEIDSEGNPKPGNIKEIKSTPDRDRLDYNKYRYNTIEVEFERIENFGARGTTQIKEKIVNINYPIKISIPSRFSKKTISIPIPEITFTRISGGPKIGPKKGIPCPDVFSKKETYTTKLGFGIRKVVLASWKSDLTK